MPWVGEQRGGELKGDTGDSGARGEATATRDMELQGEAMALPVLQGTVSG